MQHNTLRKSGLKYAVGGRAGDKFEDENSLMGTRVQSLSLEMLDSGF